MREQISELHDVVLANRSARGFRNGNRQGFVRIIRAVLDKPDFDEELYARAPDGWGAEVMRQSFLRFTFVIRRPGS